MSTTRTRRPYPRKLRSANLRARFAPQAPQQREQAARLPRIGVVDYAKSTSPLLVNSKES